MHDLPTSHFSFLNSFGGIFMNERKLMSKMNFFKVLFKILNIEFCDFFSHFSLFKKIFNYLQNPLKNIKNNSNKISLTLLLNIFF